jgi:CubicO group peptidase (beta-lactamase class C family)
MKQWLILVFCIAFLHGLVMGQPLTKKQQINLVESNLMPYVPVKGFAGWNIKGRMAYHQIPGMGVAVISNYKIDWAKSYGLADTTKKTFVDRETMFSAGSISKLVTATIVLRLVERGLLALDSPINNYLSSWKLTENDFTKARPITLRLLLSHTAGTSQSAYFGYQPAMAPFPSVPEILSGAPNTGANRVVVNSEPGKAFRYSGGGTLIVQMALMDLLKTDFETIARREIFDQIGMIHSTFEQPLSAKYDQHAAWGYSAASWYKGMPYVYPQQSAAGLYTTPTDLANFIIDLQKSFLGKGKLLKPASFKAMTTPVADISDGGYKEQIGLGAFLLQRTDNNLNTGRYFEHQGANAGFISFAFGSVEGGNGVVIMMNSGDDFNGFGTELRRSVAKVYNWTNFLPDAIQPIKLSKDSLMKYTGRYRKGINEVLTLRREADYLIEQINDSKNIYCFMIGSDSLVFTDYNIRGYFKRNAAGEILSLRNMYQTEEQAMPKMKDDEFTPSEYLKMGDYSNAKTGFRTMNMNEYQISYLAYDYLHKKPLDTMAVHTILELSSELFPKSSIVQSRWGDFFKVKGDLTNALQRYQRALDLDPGNAELIAQIKELYH